MIFDTRLLLLTLAGIVLVGILWRLVHTRRSAEPRARFKKASTAFLADFLIPDGEGGEIHVENALLCNQGIVLVNIKDVSGNIFGSNSMQEWAVITEERRFGFANPQDGLYDRTAAVARIVPEVPVVGYIAFTDQADFSKGYPDHVIKLGDLLDKLEQEHDRQNAIPDAFWPSWEKLVAAATVKPVEELAKGET